MELYIVKYYSTYEDSNQYFHSPLFQLYKGRMIFIAIERREIRGKSPAPVTPAGISATFL